MKEEKLVDEECEAKKLDYIQLFHLIVSQPIDASVLSMLT